uniref:Uncharacterized protein n=1 Tax=Leersia perrieri TaxID=77586 RepID=A0A0D9WY05_9ORYZ
MAMMPKEHEGQGDDDKQGSDDCVEVDTPNTQDITKYFSLLSVVFQMGAPNLLGGLSNYVNFIGNAFTLQKVWVQNSKPYLISLSVKKLQLIVKQDQPTDHETFNLVVRNFTYDDIRTMKETKGTVTRHYVDLRFWIFMAIQMMGSLFLFILEKEEKKLFILDPSPFSVGSSRSPLGPYLKKIVFASDYFMKAMRKSGWTEDIPLG